MRNAILALVLALATPVLAVVSMIAVMASQGHPLAFVGLFAGSVVSPLISAILSIRHLVSGNVPGRRISVAALTIDGLWLLGLLALFATRGLP
jgi:hypothetical protein